MILIPHFTKQCSKCKEINYISRFSKNKSNKDGISCQCKECEKLYKITNKIKIAEQMRIYKQLNKEKLSDYNSNYSREYQIKNKQKLSEYYNEYRKTERGKATRKNSNHKRRTITKQGDVTSNQILKLQNNAKTCYWCNCSLKKKTVQIDHYEPLIKGGEHTLSNLVVVCPTCNQKKHSKDPIQFANIIGRLL